VESEVQKDTSKASSQGFITKMGQKRIETQWTNCRTQHLFSTVRGFYRQKTKSEPGSSDTTSPGYPYHHHHTQPPLKTAVTTH
jgi:hypothetical protein